MKSYVRLVMAASILSGLAIYPTNSVEAEVVTISGTNAFFEVAADSLGNVPITEWQGIPDRPDVAYPYLTVREFWDAGGPETGAFEQRVYLRVKLSAIPSGSIVTNAAFGLCWFNNNGTAYQSDFIDLWSVADEFTGAVNFQSYDGSGTNAWTDGFAAGINGYLRTGPTGRFLGSIYHSEGGITNAASNQIINGVQEYKIFSQVDGMDTNGFIFSTAYLSAYLTDQVAAGKDALFCLSSANGDGGWQSFVSTSDNRTYWYETTGMNPMYLNQPYLQATINPPVPVIQSIVGAGTANVIITWSAVSNRTYQLQYNPDLSATNWVAITPDVIATGDTVSATNNPAGASQRYYRVELLP